jgi:hypothetical protein
LVRDTVDVSIASNGRSGSARINVLSLAVGDYKLYFEVTDIAGNRATGTYSYRVGTNEPIVGGETFNYPNPFTPEDGYTTFHLPFEAGSGAGAFASIKIYDLAGNYVYTVFEGAIADASQELRWYGRSDGGEEVANGVYLAHVSVSGGGKSVETVVKVAYKKESK